MRLIDPADPALKDLLGGAQQRFARLVAAAEAKARPFYARIFGQELSIAEAIARIFAEVERDGDAALVRYGKLFDRSELDPARLRVGADEISSAWCAVSPELRQALEQATAQITAYQRRLLPEGYERTDFAELDWRWTPLERVGAYVPGGAGGSLPLCSTVLMNLVPARVAGVRERVLVTPPRVDGSIAPELLAACHAAGVTEVWRVGGVQAIAALATGTANITRVDKIVGPGNIFVTLAKRHAYGRVDIDMLAGPSEVLVIADGSVPASWVAADLLSQAEHDELAMCVLLTVPGPSGDSRAVAAGILHEVGKQCLALPEPRRAVATASLASMGVAVPCAGLDQALHLSDRIAPEHLELLIADAATAAARLRHCGACFIGPWSPEPIGDYVAGPSHTLPTGGTARMWSGIGADTFLKRTSIINLSEAGFRRLAGAGLTLARAEGLEAHARSIAVRTDELLR